MKLNVPLSHKIQIIAHKLKLRAERTLIENFNISFNEYMILHILKNKSGQSQHSLSQIMGITPAGVSNRVQALLKRSFIMIKVNQENRRKNIVTISTKGKIIEQKASKKLSDDFNESLNKMKNLTAFENTLDKMIETLSSLNTTEDNKK